MSISFAPKGQDPFGFGRKLSEELEKARINNTQLEIPQSKSEKLNFDPSKAKYFDLATGNQKGKFKLNEKGLFLTFLFISALYPLNEEEKKLFLDNGFVVCERFAQKRCVSFSFVGDFTNSNFILSGITRPLSFELITSAIKLRLFLFF